MLNKLKQISTFYFIACISIVVGLVFQDFHKVPLTGGIIVLGLLWIGSFGMKEKFQVLRTKPIALSFISLYILHLISLLYSSNTTVALSDLELKVTLLLLPIFILSTQLFSNSKKEFLLQVFAISMIGMALYDLYIAYIEYLRINKFEVFYYKNLPHLLVGKPHYVAWYYSFAMFIALREILVFKKQKVLWGMGFCILILSLILLSSRAYLIAFVLVSAVSGFIWFRKNNSTKPIVIKLFLPLTVVIGLSVILPNTRGRISDTYAEINKLFNPKDHRQTNPRVYIWKSAAELIADKPLLGHGVGDAKDELGVALQNCDALFWNGNENVPLNRKSLNFHNQFLQTWAEVGLLGIFLLVFLIVYPFVLNNQHPLFLIFIGLTFVGFLTESMLERQAGVVMFAFMYPLLSSLNTCKSNQIP